VSREVLEEKTKAISRTSTIQGQVREEYVASEALSRV
jgi:hypothetical protein